MLVGMAVLAVRLEREGRSRSWTVEETERPSGRGGKIPSSEVPESSSSGPATCPLTGSEDDGCKIEFCLALLEKCGSCKMLTCRGTCGLTDEAAFACWADLVMNAGWFVLMYAACISIRLCAYSDVGPSRSRRSSDTTSISCACNRGKRCSS